MTGFERCCRVGDSGFLFFRSNGAKRLHLRLWENIGWFGDEDDELLIAHRL